jgi:hypothetical protein
MSRIPQIARHFLQAQLCLLLVLGMNPSARGESDWIRPGAYIDWPETLKEPALSDSSPEPQEITQTQFTQVEPNPQVPLQTPMILPLAPAERGMPGTSAWQILPAGLLYHSYLAGEKEPRFASQWLSGNDGRRWEMALGGRLGLIRHGTYGINAEGFQFDVEGAALGRINPNLESDPLEGTDYRAGFLGTWRYGPWRWKAGYYHLSSHAGDEYLLNNPLYVRRNYVRDSLIVGCTFDVRPDFQIYGELANALGCSGGAEAWEFQFGAQYFPAYPTGFRGAPFAAINGHVRQDNDWMSSVNLEAGWAWRGSQSAALLRAGFQHYNGPAMQWEFFTRHESLTGFGIWYDF